MAMEALLVVGERDLQQLDLETERLKVDQLRAQNQVGGAATADLLLAAVLRSVVLFPRRLSLRRNLTSDDRRSLQAETQSVQSC